MIIIEYINQFKEKKYMNLFTCKSCKVNEFQDKLKASREYNNRITQEIIDERNKNKRLMGLQNYCCRLEQELISYKDDYQKFKDKSYKREQDLMNEIFELKYKLSNCCVSKH